MPRYDAIRKVDKELVLAYRQAHPDWSLKEIAQKFGVTRGRIFQILKEAKGIEADV